MTQHQREIARHVASQSEQLAERVKAHDVSGVLYFLLLMAAAEAANVACTVNRN